MSNYAVISFSGGIDSTSLLLNLLSLKNKIFAITFDYGQKHKIEIDKTKFIINYLKDKNYTINHKIINISDCMNILDSSLTNKKLKIPEGYYEEKNMQSTVVPNRNAIFSSILYGYALTISKNNQNKDVKICLGVHSGDHAIYPDCRKTFYKHLIKAFEIGNWDTDNVTMYLPYINYTKAEIIKDAINSTKILGLNFETIFKNTLTSYEPDKMGISSGKTGSDIERILAFDQLSLKDPLEYHDSWEVVLENAKKAERKFKN